MRSIRNILLIIAAMVFAVACNKPKVIPDGEFRQILADIYLTNAYYNTIATGKKDTIDMYTPILRKYGYTLEDFTHMMENFSKRKSARISDQIDRTLEDMEKIADGYRQQVSVLDSVDARASRMFMREVFYRETLQARRIADTAGLRLRLPVTPAVYDISYYYMVDSLDKNHSLKTTFTLLDSAGNRRLGATNWMSARRRQRYSTRITSTAAEDSLEILFGNYPDDLTAPHLTIDSIRIIRFLNRDQALDSLDMTIFDFREHIYARFYETTIPADSSALDLLQPETPPQGDIDTGE